MKCGVISAFDRKVICWSDAASGETSLIAMRHRSDCGRNRLRDRVAPVPGLPRVDANTIHLPSGENTGEKLWTRSPLESATAGVTRAHAAGLSSLVMNTPSGSFALARAANTTRLPSLATSGVWMSPPAARPGHLSLIHISEPTRLLSISYAVFCLKK